MLIAGSCYNSNFSHDYVASFIKFTLLLEIYVVTFDIMNHSGCFQMLVHFFWIMTLECVLIIEYH
jgi:hypothetical protein